MIHQYVFELASWSERETSVSCFRAAVREARSLTGRNVDTGALRPRLKKDKAQWAGTLTYLILLDQIGQVITPKRRPHSSPPFIVALKEFAPSLSTRDREMLYGLRCALGHEFGLANPGRANMKDDPRRHLFTLYESTERRLVVYPTRRWNGRYGARANHKTGITHLNTTELGNVIEEVIGRIEDGARAGSLHLVEGITPTMVRGRWGFRVIDDG